MGEFSIQKINKIRNVIANRYQHLTDSEIDGYVDEILERTATHLAKGHLQSFVEENDDGSMELYIYFAEQVIGD